ncbi:hypothetical protein FTX61_06995 [Nitriliruptoraceae bacterium ZYF776]|nr:hypothetical protein [Profundirhabdus halotolerans]
MSSEPVPSAADAAREALRALAHATQTIPELGDSYSVLGSLHAGLSSLRQTLDQLADLHERHAPRAVAADPDQLGREVAADIAAAELREAAALLERANGRVSAAWSHNGRIVWQPEPPAPPSLDGSRRLATPSSFGAPTAVRGSEPLTR